MELTRRISLNIGESPMKVFETKFLKFDVGVCLVKILEVSKYLRRKPVKLSVCLYATNSLFILVLGIYCLTIIITITSLSIVA